MATIIGCDKCGVLDQEEATLERPATVMRSAVALYSPHYNETGSWDLCLNCSQMIFAEIRKLLRSDIDLKR